MGYPTSRAPLLYGQEWPSLGLRRELRRLRSAECGTEKAGATDIEHGWSLVQGDNCWQRCCFDVGPALEIESVRDRG